MQRWWTTGAAETPVWVPRRARTAGRGEAVVIVDVDQFRAILARHGVTAGEQVTRAVGDCLRARLRACDRLALLRDDEFLAVLPGAGEATLEPIAARLRDSVHALRLALAGEVWSLSCTLGAAARGRQSASLEALVRAADSALHHARHPQAQPPMR